MSYRRRHKKLAHQVKTWEVMSLVSGNTIADAEDLREAQDLAEDYRMNPDLVFLGFDRKGYCLGSWSSDDLLNE